MVKKSSNKGDSFFNIISWFGGVVLTLFGASLISKYFLSGILMFAGASFLLPPIRKIIYSKFHLKVPGALRAILVFSLFLGSMVFFAKQQHKVAKVNNLKNNQQKIIQKKKKLLQKNENLEVFKNKKEKILKEIKSNMDKKVYFNAIAIASKYIHSGDEKLLVLYREAKKKHGELNRITLIRKKFTEIVKPKSILDLDLIPQVDGGYAIKIEYQAADNLTESWTYKSIIDDTIRFSKTLFTDKKYTDIKWFMLRPNLIFIDKFGKETQQEVASLVLERETAEKINWDNMLPAMFVRLLKENKSSMPQLYWSKIDF
ncbi:hypothetical protein BVY03_01725 [bacterium K02(2017)]|nr:hypothetical protein BVY03_01725 [bacterium K02(2017)]